MLGAGEVASVGPGNPETGYPENATDKAPSTQGTGPDPAGSEAAADVSQVESFEDFKARLAATGIKTQLFGRRRSSFGTTKTLQDLHREVLMRESLICIESGKAVQHLEILKVYLLAEVGGETCCLIEHDQFDLQDGKQRAVMQPLQKKMRSGETDWREVLSSALHDLVGVDQAWQQANLEVDEESYAYHEERTASLEYPELPTMAKVHEIHVRVKVGPPQQVVPIIASEENDEPPLDPLEQIGLPNGRDFVTREVCPVSRQVRLHVWCWKSREYERNSRLLEFGEYLTSRGVDISQFGTGMTKTLFQMYLEVKELQESHLQEVTQAGGIRRGGFMRLLIHHPIRLQRVVELLKVKLIAEVHRRNRVLSIAEQFMDDSRKRKVQRLPAIKLRHGADEKQALQKMLLDRLGIEPSVQAAYIEQDDEKEEYMEEWKPSDGYAGIPSFYKIRTITLHIRDPQCEDFLRIGLPRGNDFVTREGSMGEKKGGKVNVWTWLPLKEDEDAEEGNIFAGTGLEDLSRNLHDVEDLIHQTCRHPDVQSAGLDRPLNTALQKIRWCSERSSNIDETLGAVDVKAMMSSALKRRSSKDVTSPESFTPSTQSPASPGTSRADLAGLADFITSNFTRHSRDSVIADAATLSKLESLRAKHEEAERNGDSPDEESPDALLSTTAAPAMQYATDNLDNWGLDMFALNDKSNSKVIEVYGEVALVQQCKIALGCRQDATRNFLEKVQSLYLDNPYHNALHAVQVCHSACWLTRNLGLMEHQSELERAAFAISTLCHDVKHFGVNNMFLINSEHSLALLYNNSKVLENMHSATCWDLLQSPGGSSMLGALSREDRANMRSQIIEYILATDMSEHFEVISKFRVKLEASEFSVLKVEDRRFVARMCMKSGDIGHASLPWDLHANWSLRVQREFFNQGEKEQRLGLPVSALCDRSSVKDAAQYGNSQKGFLEFVCLPLFNVVVNVKTAKSESEEGSSNQNPRKNSGTGEIVRTSETSSTIQQLWVGTLKQNQTNWLEDMEMRAHVQKVLIDATPTS